MRQWGSSMTSNAWDQMSLEEKIDELHRMLTGFIAMADENVDRANKASLELSARVGLIEAALQRR